MFTVLRCAVIEDVVEPEAWLLHALNICIWSRDSEQWCRGKSEESDWAHFEVKSSMIDLNASLDTR